MGPGLVDGPATAALDLLASSSAISAASAAARSRLSRSCWVTCRTMSGSSMMTDSSSAVASSSASVMWTNH